MKIEIQDSEINVEDIMKQIRENIRKRKYDGEVDLDQLKKIYSVHQPPQSSSSMNELLREQSILNRTWSYSADYLISSHRRWIGRFIVLGKKVIRKCLRWYINPVVDKQVQFNATVVRAINQLVDLTRQNSEALANQERQSQLEERLTQLEQSVQSLQNIFSNLQDAYSNMQNTLSNLQNPISNFQDILSNEINSVRSELINQISRHVQELEQLKLNSNLAGNRLRRLERNLRGQVQQEEYQPVLSNPPAEPLDFDYYLFEEYYRGSREQIMEGQRRYLHYFSKGQFVLDLGCGRGEFLELLSNYGVRAEGVELNDDMIAYCRERGFTVHKADLLEYLSNVEDNSVDGIFLGQVIEHLQPQQLIRLIRLAHAKLKPNGCFIAETPNPRSLSIYAQSFYMDMTHTKPVHPLTAKFLLETEGYRNIEIHYFSPNSDDFKWQELKLEGADPEMLKRLNTTMEHWYQFIFGEQDYCIVGRK